MLNTPTKVVVILLIIIIMGGAFALWSTLKPHTSESPTTTAGFDSQQSNDINVNEVISKRPLISEGEELVEILNSVFTDAERDTPVFKQFTDIVQSPEYEQFLQTEPETLGSFFNFFESQGLPVNMDQMMSVYLELAPIGTPEELERRAYVTLSRQFQDIPYNIHSIRGRQEFKKILDTYFEDKENVAWVMTHFNGNYEAFGDWAVDVVRNPIDFDKEPEFNFDTQDLDNVVPPEIRPDLNPNQIPVKADDMLTDVTKGPVLPESERNIKDSEQQQIPINALFKEIVANKRFTERQIHEGMELLRVFGNDEGIQRLKAIHPEMAEHLTQIIRNREKTGR